jgi:CheY-like chemotaxis protein/anti-sigma regulatory factor (Ser/Thr protein kinase)
LRIDPGVPKQLVGDAGRLRQIIMNLVTNAVKFTHEGSVEIDTSLELESDVEVTLLVAVKDTGIGIPEKDWERLFLPFTQVDGSTTREYGGTGLGLAISQQLSDGMGGGIVFESEVGKGSTFTLRARFLKSRCLAIEVGDGDAEDSDVASSGAVAVERRSAKVQTRSSIRVLLAEDNIVNRKVALGFLKKLGIDAMAVGDGFQAIEVLQENDFDIVLMDIQMPKMNGYEATRLIRNADSESRMAAVPIIALTAHAMEGDRERCIEAGMNDYLSKPIDIDALKAVLQKWA